MSDSQHDSLPTFIGIGTMKSGTTSLFGYLDSHPNVFMAEPKELNYFLDQGSWELGADWYRERFAAGAQAIARGEVSPSYGQTHLYPEVPERMAALVPSARLIFLVREPIERIRSMYAHLRIDGLESLTIDEAVVANPDYVETSRYIRHLETYASWFPRSQIHVCISERLRRDPVGELDKMAAFIGVPTWTDLAMPVAEDRNVTDERTVENRVGLQLKRRSQYWKAINRSWRLREVHRRVFERTVSVPDTSLASEVESRLRSEFADDTAALEQWLGSPIEEWRPGERSDPST